MTLRLRRSALLLTVLSTTGCGTVANLADTNTGNGGRIPFGGVKRDAAVLHSTGDGPTLIAHREFGVAHSQHMLRFLCAVDLPFSFVGDVATWPYTAAYTTVNEPLPAPVLFAGPSVNVAAQTTSAPATTPPMMKPDVPLGKPTDPPAKKDTVPSATPPPTPSPFPAPPSEALPKPVKLPS